MKITHVNCYQVVVPVREGVATSDGYGPAVFDQTPKIMFEAHTDEGYIGLGETPRGVSEPVLCKMLDGLRGMEITGLCLQDPPLYDFSYNDTFAHEHPKHRHRFSEQFFGAYHDIGVHAMLFDLLGKKLNVPAHDLMGGACRKRVRADYWMGRMNPEDSARICKHAQELGYQGAKCKCALEDDNVERAEAIKGACGVDFSVTFDPNGRFYRYGESIDMLRHLAAVGNIGCVEDPFPRHFIEEYRLLRSQGLFPVAVHVGYNRELLDVVKREACDFVNLSDLPWRVLQAASICWLANLPTWHGSGIDLGVLEALTLQVCAAARSMTRPCDILGRMIREHNLVDDEFAINDGRVAVPSGPGLGVSIDRDALDHYTQKTFTFKMD